MSLKSALLALAAASVSVAGERPLPKPAVAVPDRFRNLPPGAADVTLRDWWKGFGDPLLNELMERAAEVNPDVRTAAARLSEAEALRAGGRSALFPGLDLTGAANRLRGGFNQGVVRVPGADGASRSGSFVTPFETTILSGGFNMRWEADVFGGVRKSLRAATADASAAEAARRDAILVVRGEVARNYIELRGLERQLAVVQAEIASEADQLELVRVRADAGLASNLDVERQAAQLASIRAVAPELESQRSHTMHRISVLLGQQPAALVDRLRAAAPELDVPPTPSAVPSEVLKRRPDIRRAEAEIAAAYARAGAARADLFPKFVITGLTGRQATDLPGLTLGAGNFFSFGPGISLPIFNAGRIRSNIAASDARLEQAVRAYENEVLTAFEETENAFVSRERAEQRRRELETAVAAARRSVEMATELYVRGLADFLTVLDARRQQFQLERELAAGQTAVLRSVVALFKALG